MGTRVDAVEPDSVPSTSPANGGGFQERATRLERELFALFFELLERRRATRGERDLPARVHPKLILELTDAAARTGVDGNGHCAGQLLHQLQRAVDRHIERAATFPLGRVYCHWCRSFTCEHSAPPESRSIFGGYTATGQPRWPEFVSVLIEKRHPRIDDVFRETPAPITLLQGGNELASEQLPIYGKHSPIYRILGQVALGYLFLPVNGSGKRAPLAITFQAVEPRDGGQGLGLNVLGRLQDGTPAYQAIEESSDSRLADALLTARRSLDELALFRSPRRGREAERKRRVFGILNNLARNIDRIFRQRSRRTQHSQDRHLERGRPASSALKDALQATPEAIYRDVEERTWVVIGPKNRVHVFNDQALHVTSVVYPGETVRQRTTRGKWRTPPAEEMAAFQAALKGRASPAG
jgi:hypothetical protein